MSLFTKCSAGQIAKYKLNNKKRMSLSKFPQSSELEKTTN